MRARARVTVDNGGSVQSVHGSAALISQSNQIQCEPYLRHGIDRGDAFPCSTIYDGAFTSSAEADAQTGLGQR